MSSRDYSRSERLASQIQRELASLIQSGIKDPALGMPSILEVEVSRDLAHARVYFSLLDPDDAAASLQALNRAAGFLQREIGKRIKSRVTPRLSFIYDDTDIRGRELADLIDTAVANDKRKSED